MNTVDFIVVDNIVPSLGPMPTSNEIGDELVHFFTFRVAASNTMVIGQSGKWHTDGIWYLFFTL